MCTLLILNYVTHYEMRFYVENVMNYVMDEVERLIVMWDCYVGYHGYCYD